MYCSLYLLVEHCKYSEFLPNTNNLSQWKRVSEQEVYQVYEGDEHLEM